MNKYAYSPSGNIFYPTSLKSDYVAADAWPDDAFNIDDAIADEFMSDAPVGKMRGASVDGLPRWDDIS